MQLDLRIFLRNVPPQGEDRVMISPSGNRLSSCGTVADLTSCFTAEATAADDSGVRGASKSWSAADEGTGVEDLTG